MLVLRLIFNAHVALSNQPALVPEEESGPLPPQKSKMACIEYIHIYNRTLFILCRDY